MKGIVIVFVLSKKLKSIVLLLFWGTVVSGIWSSSQTVEQEPKIDLNGDIWA